MRSRKRRGNGGCFHEVHVFAQLRVAEDEEGEEEHENLRRGRYAFYAIDYAGIFITIAHHHYHYRRAVPQFPPRRLREHERVDAV